MRIRRIELRVDRRGAHRRGTHAIQGVLELHPKGFGFLRNPTRHYAAQPADPYVPAPLVQKMGLREGLLIAGPTESAARGSGPRLSRVVHIEGEAPDKFARRNFDDPGSATVDTQFRMNRPASKPHSPRGSSGSCFYIFLDAFWQSRRRDVDSLFKKRPV